MQIDVSMATLAVMGMIEAYRDCPFYPAFLAGMAKHNHYPHLNLTPSSQWYYLFYRISLVSIHIWIP